MTDAAIASTPRSNKRSDGGRTPGEGEGNIFDTMKSTPLSPPPDLIRDLMVDATPPPDNANDSAPSVTAIGFGEDFLPVLLRQGDFCQLFPGCMGQQCWLFLRGSTDIPFDQWGDSKAFKVVDRTRILQPEEVDAYRKAGGTWYRALDVNSLPSELFHDICRVGVIAGIDPDRWRVTVGVPCVNPKRFWVLPAEKLQRLSPETVKAIAAAIPRRT